MKTALLLPIALLAGLLSSPANGQVPQLMSYQGRLSASGTNLCGPAELKFALVSGEGAETYWSNDGSSTQGSQPSTAVCLPVTNGLFNVLLGDVTLTNMTPVPVRVFANSAVWLRLWVRTGTNDFVRLDPDQRIAAVGYAMMAANLPDGTITDRHVSPQAGISASKIVGLTAIPRGVVVMWSGSIASIPSAWALCDGGNGTPDLRDRFVVGSSASRAVGSAGGSKSHSHSASTGQSSTFVNAGGGGNAVTYYTHTHPVNIVATNHLPPYYALAFIMKL